MNAVPLPYDHPAWQYRFLDQWSPHSPAHRSYFDQINGGTALAPQQAAAPGFRPVSA